ncbi:uncharacterized protein PHALS_10661 [Plasmopara halstedii]|uniref:RxLR-like protein n=2 Tax=Plasmopara halstedii TaxID=4781 RepID=A0A0P1AI99_PLAHL|nr:uncharacterized protein PHALS_10661 [Plasmopara halstedii]CEG40464.1 hypothetical protein PHALS_10661 [Plasmopara halstedii]|eukprot:XP_024576833.1 hypothetical protein PHALS_10661 [Plasmopara halstedii]
MRCVSSITLILTSLGACSALNSSASHVNDSSGSKSVHRSDLSVITPATKNSSIDAVASQTYDKPERDGIDKNIHREDEERVEWGILSPLLNWFKGINDEKKEVSTLARSVKSQKGIELINKRKGKMPDESEAVRADVSALFRKAKGTTSDKGNAVMQESEVFSPRESDPLIEESEATTSQTSKAAMVRSELSTPQANKSPSYEEQDPVQYGPKAQTMWDFCRQHLIEKGFEPAKYAFVLRDQALTDFEVVSKTIETAMEKYVFSPEKKIVGFLLEFLPRKRWFGDSTLGRWLDYQLDDFIKYFDYSEMAAGQRLCHDYADAGMEEELWIILRKARLFTNHIAPDLLNNPATRELMFRFNIENGVKGEVFGKALHETEDTDDGEILRQLASAILEDPKMPEAGHPEKLMSLDVEEPETPVLRTLASKDEKKSVFYWIYSKPGKFMKIFEEQLGSDDQVRLFQGVLNDNDQVRLFKAALKNDDQVTLLKEIMQERMSVDGVDTQRMAKFEAGLKCQEGVKCKTLELFRAALSNDRTAKNFQVLLESSSPKKLFQILVSHWYRKEFARYLRRYIDKSN